MRPFLTLSPTRTEAGEIELADGFPYMLLGAPRTKWAETLFVMGARGKLGGRVDVQVEAFVAVAAVEGSGVLIAFGHATSA